jgi:hypothetical protein
LEVDAFHGDLNMKRLASALLLLSATFALPACARNERLVDVQVQDQDSGTTLPRLPYAGRDYIEGQPGHRFAVTLQNLTGERVLAVVSVDGVNAISGQTAGTSQSGYVLDPWQRIEVRGWRKSYSDVAEFYFTDLPDSYAARTGRPMNVGVIGVAAFRERRYEPVPYEPMPQIGRSDYPSGSGSAQAERAAAPAAKSADSVAGASTRAYEDQRRDNGLARQELGTGHGQRRYDPATRTVFERASSRPNQVVSLFYDSYDALVAKGVLPTRGYRTDPEPFPVGFAPDPRY